MKPAQAENLILLAAFVVALVMAVAAMPHLPQYTIWSDRDLLRAARLFIDYPTTGAEMNGTYMARSPGAAYYYLLRLLMSVSARPEAVHAGCIALVMAAAIATFLAARTAWGIAQGAIAGAIVVAAPAIGTLMLTIWNPALSIPLNCLISILLIYLVRGRPWLLPWIAGVIAVAIQVHLSNLTLLPAVTLAVILFARGLRPRDWVLAIVVLVGTFSPYLIDEMQTGWKMTRLILIGQGQPQLSSPHPFELLRVLIAIAGGPDPQAALSGLGIDDMAQAVAAALAILAIGVRVATAGWRLWQYRSAPGKPDVPQGDRDVLMFAVLLAGVGLLLVANRNSSVLLRYATPLIGPMVMLAGAAVGDLIGGLAASLKHGAWPSRIAAAGVAFVIVALAIVRYGPARQDGYPSDIENAVAALRQDFGLSDGALKSRVLILNDEASARFVTAGYINTLVPISNLPPQEFSGCVAVGIGIDSAEKLTAELRTLATKLPGGEPHIEKIVRTGNLRMVGYRLADGNCWRSLNNPYDPMADETTSEAICAAMSEDGTHVSRRRSDATAPVEWIVFRRTIPTIARLCLAFHVTAENGIPVATLYSTHFRGYTGFPTDGYQLLNPHLTFSMPEGTSLQDVALANGKIGGQNNPAMTPWRVRLPQLPAPLGTMTFTAVLASTQNQSDVNIHEHAELAGLSWPTE